MISKEDFGGGLLMPSMKQTACFKFLERDHNKPEKIVLTIGLMSGDKYTETPRSLRFLSVPEFDRFIVQCIKARLYFMKKKGILTPFNRDYHYCSFIKEIQEIFFK